MIALVYHGKQAKTVLQGVRNQALVPYITDHYLLPFSLFAHRCEPVFNPICGAGRLCITYPFRVFHALIASSFEVCHPNGNFVPLLSVKSQSTQPIDQHPSSILSTSTEWVSPQNGHGFSGSIFFPFGVDLLSRLPF